MEALTPRPIDGTPMFPLGQVLLPSTGMGLHVFESRFRQLVVDCLASEHDPPELASTLIERGHEVGGDDERATVGVLAHMQGVEAMRDGRYTFVAVGVRRVRVTEWLDDDPYPRARVESWPDPDADDPTLLGALRAAAQRAEQLRRLIAEAQGAAAVPGELVIDDLPVIGCYQLAAQLPIGPADRHRLLRAPTVRTRFDVLDDVFDDLESMLKFGMT
ncbi:MAG: LON peptidase substrate-binding domain-containing protein [Actinomycetota bacterium]|nr:LON peptidase substrate-binding domain-containing protein [Actinomycetota bacterium]